MMRKRAATKANPTCLLRLYVAGDAPNSLVARENLRQLMAELPAPDVCVEVVDVMHDPDAALEAGVYLTPALQIMAPGAATLVFGNLSNRETLRTLFQRGASAAGSTAS